MAITFPSNPSLNDTFTSGGKTFQWNGTSWTVNQEANILTDTTPQLGGNLDLNSQDITGTGDINVTGTITATSFSGTLNSSDLTGALPALDGSALTGAGTTTTAEWTLGADGSNHYTFTGPGVTAGATDPTIYLTRGQTYKFKNRSGGHPFRIQTSFQNTGGTAYTDGITISDGSTASSGAGNNTDLYWEVRNDTPDVLYYQCTSHTNMSGRINMIGGESKVVGLTSTTATARDAGITTATGSIIYVPDVGLQVYTGNVAGWKTIADTDAGQNSITATGGSVTTITGYKVHTFTSSGQFTISDGEGNIEYLVVAGGGAGSKAHTTNSCGGGGAGGYRTNVPGQNSGGGANAENVFPLGPGTYTVTVGAGGVLSSSPGNTLGTNGSNSVFGTIVSTGGGRGGGEPGAASQSGGSGGGAGSHQAPQGTGNFTGASGTTNQGYPGGNCSGGSNPQGAGGGGGGGAGAQGTNVATSSYNGGAGGIGVPSNIDGTATYRGGGGGGSAWSSNQYTAGAGGTGGGGKGARTDNTSSDQNEHGTANTGGGGGGGKANNNQGNGGSGIVIVRYPA